MKLARILAQAERHPVGEAMVHVIAIDGRSGSGKTTLASELTAAITQRRQQPVVVVHTDELLGGWEGLPGLGQRLADDLLRPFLAGLPGHYRRFDWDAYCWAETVQVPAAPWLIIEGVGAGSRQCAELVSLLVWLEADRKVERERGLSRGCVSFAANWDRWEAAETKHYALHHTRSRAGLVLAT
ncbi:MAG: 4-amino-4-deoxy-L-arabinose transferase [Arachnia propionica]|nr:MAG: 4-amino-4-deoxy-L-arabinose transferase [Arachnia propionica]